MGVNVNSQPCHEVCWFLGLVLGLGEAEVTQQLACSLEVLCGADVICGDNDNIVKIHFCVYTSACQHVNNGISDSLHVGCRGPRAKWDLGITVIFILPFKTQQRII